MKLPPDMHCTGEIDRLTGPNGRTLQVVTIWMTDAALGLTKFVTLYPDK